MAGSWRRGLTSGCLVAACVLALTGGARAQTLTSGGIGGVVRDGAGQPLEQVAVTLTNAETGVTRAIVTGRNGGFDFPGLTPGEYAVLAERVGYRPKRVVDVPVRAIARTSVVVLLTAAPPPVGEAEVERYGGMASSGGGTGEWFGPAELRAYPDLRRELARVGRLSSMSGPDAQMQGLPAWMTGVVVDGLAIEPLRHPALGGGSLRTAAFPLGSMESAELVSGPVDLEWPGSAGGLVSGSTRGGSRKVELRGFGAWSGGPLGNSSPAAQELGPAADIQGGATLSGPFAGDSAHFLVGFEGRRVERPFGAAWAGSAAASLRSAAQSVYGISLDPYFASRDAVSSTLATFARVDWQLTPNHALELRGAYALLPKSDAWATAGAPLPGPLSSFDGSDLSLGATLRSVLGERTGSELRLGADRNSRTYSSIGNLAASQAELPFMRVVSDALAFGSDPVLPGDFRQTTVRGSESVLYRAGLHELKIGVEAALSKYDETYRPGGRGEVYFGDVSAFTERKGVFRQVTGPAANANFSVPQIALLAQDHWSPVPGLELTFGVRAEREQLPNDVAPNERWKALTGLSNATLPGNRLQLSPRAGLSWDLDRTGRWIVEAGGGLYNERVDPAVIAALLTDDGRSQVRRGAGTLSAWPTLRVDTSATTLAPSLTMLGPKFQGPRTGRLTGAVTVRVAPATNLRLAGVLRHTDFLPRRTDLNLVAATGQDQWGRPLYGTLLQEGGLLAGMPGSNRRFGEFDVVSAITADGGSDYRGITLSLKREPVRGIGLLASYTYSQTTDDWPGGGGDPLAAPLTTGSGPIGAGWADGTSDFDVPHRLVFGGQVSGPFGSRLSALYRYASGRPFMPGFPQGVDANGDGVAGNDPAFISADVAGAQQVVDAWACLRTQSGGFAARNSCRTPAASALDARLEVRLFTVRGSEARLRVDALDLVHTADEVPDAALYLVDPTGTLGTAGGRTTVPLVANPHFGKSLGPGGAGRTLLLGLSLNW